MTETFEEVFIKAYSRDEAEVIDRLNNGEAKRVKAARLRKLAQQGTVHEVEMPDIQDAALEAGGDWDEYAPKTLSLKVDRIDIYSEDEGGLYPSGHVKVDGHELRGVQRVVIDLEAGRRPKVMVELHPVSPDKASG